MEAATVVALCVLGTVALIAVGAVLNGYVLSVLWSWFVVPTLHPPQLSVTAAIGIAMVVSYLTYQRPAKPAKSEIAESVAYVVLKPVTALAMGWVVQSFM